MLGGRGALVQPAAEGAVVLEGAPDGEGAPAPKKRGRKAKVVQG
jgi:hypothetical protein